MHLHTHDLECVLSFLQLPSWMMSIGQTGWRADDATYRIAHTIYAPAIGVPSE